MVSLLSPKLLLISSSVLLLIALVYKISVPLVLDFSTSQAPLIWSSLLLWLKPPYLYIIINVIIITIVVSTRLYQNHEEDLKHHHQQQQQRQTVSRVVVDSHHQPYDYEIRDSTGEIRFGDVEVEMESTHDQVFEEKRVVVVSHENGGGGGGGGDINGFVDVSQSTWGPRKMTEILSPEEKPLVSSRFYHHRKPEGGRALGVLKPKRHETLENTWKTITEGRAMPLTRHLKKSDTWENRHGHHHHQVNVDDPSIAKKSETFKDRTNHQSSSPVKMTPSPIKLRKEPSLSQDELNRRVEAFINKFNEEMRLQRQESLNQYKEMVSRGNH
ncbi:DUF761 domain-containing protein/DUF4408 domain-containing protein [Cephalotus follicularis]|uniref:DUF761 domain-containing protein/DUF4408 domain-containing protein n=1 Tax=Cephalotus follicularis TaxID=3775 RepID=A0A1Q3AV69_CEPFO|nr:DUF761 domain-containing protein/DUF4408 domain-containing protein [Cephalotus follicularis]